MSPNPTPLIETLVAQHGERGLSSSRADWRAIQTRSASPKALAEFWLSPEFISGHAHRPISVEQSHLVQMSSIRGAA